MNFQEIAILGITMNQRCRKVKIVWVASTKEWEESAPQVGVGLNDVAKNWGCQWHLWHPRFHHPEFSK